MSESPATWIEVSRAQDRKTAEDHALVLEARGIGHGIAVASGQYVVLALAGDAPTARAEIEKYVRENQTWPQRPRAPEPMRWSTGGAAVYVAALVLLDLASRRGSFGLDWWHAGVADAGLIRGGAWWRAVTALSLHADLLHLAGNVAFGALFGAMLSQSIGFGLTWLAFVITGGVGNLLNAWVQSPSHASIGASTAVFGLLGVQVANDWVRRRQLHHNLFRRWAPLAFGAALLAWLGGDGRQVDPNSFPKSIGEFDVAVPKIDVWGHILGFATGVALGVVFGWVKPRLTLNAWIQAALAGAAAGLIAIAWVSAFR